jgi:hypothetical protein
LRFALLLFGAWCALLAVATVAVRRAADVEAASAERDAAHARFAKIPLEEFLRDRANLLSGRVLDSRGQAVAGAEIRVFDLEACVAAARGAAPGAWPLPAAERVVHSAEDGAYATADLTYGAKLILVTRVGLRSDALNLLPFADGYGAPETDFVLRAESARRMTVLHADGRPASGERFRLLPRAFGLADVVVTADSNGVVAIPPETESDDGPPRALWGEPPVLLELADGQAELQLPGRSDLQLELRGVGGGPVAVSFAPVGASRVGVHRLELAAGEDRFTLRGAPEAEWTVTAVGEGRIASRVLRAGERSAVLELAPPRELELRAIGEDGAAVPAEFLLQTLPPAEPPAFSGDPLRWSERDDPTAIIVASGPDGVARCAAPFAGAGWVVAAAARHAPRMQALGADARAATIPLAHAHEVAIRTDRPYLPVVVYCEGSPPVWGRSDAAAEVFVFAAEGTMVARAGLPRGGISLPRGAVVGGGVDPTLRFDALDEPGAPRGCLYGFARTPAGAPCVETRVWIQGGDGRPRDATTDAHGWFRFTQLEAGFYIGFLDPGEADAVWLREPTVLPLEADGAGTGRLDLVLHAGIVDLPPAMLGLPSGATVALCRADGATIWEGIVPEDGRLRLSRVPDGEFVLAERRAEELRTIGTLTVRADAQPATRWEAAR